jgi:hypothetical protein
MRHDPNGRRPVSHMFSPVMAEPSRREAALKGDMRCQVKVWGQWEVMLLRCQAYPIAEWLLVLQHHQQNQGPSEWPDHLGEDR